MKISEFWKVVNFFWKIYVMNVHILRNHVLEFRQLFPLEGAKNRSPKNFKKFSNKEEGWIVENNATL